MAKYATVDSAGHLQGFYDSTLHGAKLPAGAIALTDAQYAEWLAAQSTLVLSSGALVAAPAIVPSSAQVEAALKASARAALVASDVTILRCFEHDVAVPPDWQTYRTALRAIVSGRLTATALPPMPAYPIGT
jgi:hypothetical protein